MKNVSKNVRRAPQFLSALWFISFALPFVGIAMVMNCQGTAFVLGLLLLSFGLFTWTIN